MQIKEITLLKSRRSYYSIKSNYYPRFTERSLSFVFHIQNIIPTIPSMNFYYSQSKKVLGNLSHIDIHTKLSNRYPLSNKSIEHTKYPHSLQFLTNPRPTNNLSINKANFSKFKQYHLPSMTGFISQNVIMKLLSKMYPT